MGVQQSGLPRNPIIQGIWAMTKEGSGGLLRRFVSERELAIYAGVPARTLQGWRLRGQGPPYRKLCGSIRYGLAEFENWVQAQPGGGHAVA